MNQQAKDQDFMRRHLQKEQELHQAVDEMEKTASSVKEVSKSVKQGTATKSELQKLIEKLSKQGGKIKILAAEAKLFGGWTVGDENLPPKPPISKFLVLVSLIALLYIVSR